MPTSVTKDFKGGNTSVNPLKDSYLRADPNLIPPYKFTLNTTTNDTGEMTVAARTRDIIRIEPSKNVKYFELDLPEPHDGDRDIQIKVFNQKGCRSAITTLDNTGDSNNHIVLGALGSAGTITQLGSNIRPDLWYDDDPEDLRFDVHYYGEYYLYVKPYNGSGDVDMNYKILYTETPLFS